MPRLLICALTLLSASLAGAEDWLQWRGPTGDHHAPAGATAPDTWSESEGLAWSTPIPGMGHSSPTLVGDRIYLTTGDAAAGTQSLLILDRQSGELLREVVVHRGGLPAQIHNANTHASPTVASDGERVFTLFHNDAAAMVTAYDLAGEELWRSRAAGYDPQQYKFGFGSSPVLADGVLVVASEYDGPETGLYGLDPATGEPLWNVQRLEGVSYSSPAITTLGGMSRLLLTGNRQVASFDPRSGEAHFVIEGCTLATCGTMVWDEASGLAFGSGGFPDPVTVAVRVAGGQPEIVWQNRVKCYEQSMLTVDGRLYAVDDSGVAHCFRAADGEELWKERLGGRYSASPVLVDGKVYVTNESGTTFVFRETGDGYQPIAQNQLGDSGYATLTPADGRLYHRYATGSGEERQEYLAAIGE